MSDQLALKLDFAEAMYGRVSAVLRRQNVTSNYQVIPS